MPHSSAIGMPTTSSFKLNLYLSDSLLTSFFTLSGTEIKTNFGYQFKNRHKKIFLSTTIAETQGNNDLFRRKTRIMSRKDSSVFFSYFHRPFSYLFYVRLSFQLIFIFKNLFFKYILINQSYKIICKI